MSGKLYRPDAGGALLSLENLYKTFPVRRSFFSAESVAVHAVDGVSLSLAAGVSLERREHKPVPDEVVTWWRPG